MTHKILGSILIVAGTAIGGGMLAMPIISAGVGFTSISLLMILIWIVMCYTAILLAKVYQYHDPDDGLNTLTYLHLGRTGSVITGISMLTLMYALVSAYIAGGSDLLRINLAALFGWHLSTQLSAVLFTLLFGGLVSFGARVVDICTKWLFGIKLGFLLVVVLSLMPFVKSDYLLVAPEHQSFVWTAIPVILTSFGFHIVVPSLVRYLDGNLKHLKIALWGGSLLPLLVYIIWQMTMLGSVNPVVFKNILATNSGLEGMLKAVGQISDSQDFQIPLNIFTIAALLTSFLGVALALYDYLRDFFKNNRLLKHSFSISFSTFIPPLLFALYYPDGFIIALGYAAVAVAITSLFIPALLFIKVKRLHDEKIGVWRIISFIGVVGLGLLILVIQTFISLGKL